MPSTVPRTDTEHVVNPQSFVGVPVIVPWTGLGDNPRLAFSQKERRGWLTRGIKAFNLQVVAFSQPSFKPGL